MLIQHDKEFSGLSKTSPMFLDHNCRLTSPCMQQQGVFFLLDPASNQTLKQHNIRNSKHEVNSTAIASPGTLKNNDGTDTS
jgi:hypothetical protein